MLKKETSGLPNFVDRKKLPKQDREFKDLNLNNLSLTHTYTNLNQPQPKPIYFIFNSLLGWMSFGYLLSVKKIR